MGETPTDTWIRGCKDLPPEQISVGLQACLARTDTWPPMLPEFLQLCIGNWEERAQHQAAPKVKIEDLTAKEKRLEANKAALAELRAECGI